MSDKTRVPQAIEPFNSYIGKTDNYQQAITPTDPQPNYARLGLTLTESGDWTAKREYWRDVLYPAYSDENTSTSVVKRNVQLFIKDFRTFANPLLNRMAASGNATTADEAVFNFIVERDSTHTARGKIEDIPFLKIQPIGGGEVKLRARASEDGNRSSRHPLADGLEVRWVVQASGSNNDNTQSNADDSTKATATPPATAAQCTNTFTSSKALFIMELGQENKNKMFYCFIRWINLGKPANSGPWSDMFQSGIL